MQTVVPGKRVRISVIVRSKGDRARKATLQRAIASVLSQTGVDVEVIAILNGSNYDSGVVAWLQGDERIVCRVFPGPDKPAATALGRALVTGQFFTYLDDDDEFLEDALARRAAVLLERPEADCVATNGYCIDGGKSRIAYPDCADFRESFVEPLLRGHNWLTSCGTLFRTSSVSLPYFEHLTKHCEWTLIGFRIASRLRVAFLNEPTFRVYNTPISESKTLAYVETVPLVFTKMLEWNRDRRFVRPIRRCRSIAFHDACSYYRISGGFGRAWTFHVKSVLEVGGWRYVPYTLLLLCRFRLPVQAIPLLGPVFKS